MKSSKSAYDLWEGEGAAPKASQKGRKRGRVDYTPSVLPAVDLPSEGASYNPSLNSYLDYASKIARQEKEAKRQEDRLHKSLAVGRGETEGEALHEDMDILRDAVYGNYADVKDETGEIDIGEEAPNPSLRVTKPKTAKQKRAELKKKAEKQMRMKSKEDKRKKNELGQMKRIGKEVVGSEERRAVVLEARRLRRAVSNLTKRKRLGRGQFEEYAEPVLLPEELTGSLRRIKQQGSILQERVKSLQKRNILPVAGARSKPKLKAKLRSKNVEKREVKKIVKGSRVI